jgi:curved DNA-binding protein CbpA
VSSDSNLQGESLASYLAEIGLVSSGRYLPARDYASRTQVSEGAALLELQILAPLELFQALRELLRRRLIGAMEWRNGQFQVIEGEIENSDTGPLRRALPPLIQQALAAHWTADQLLDSLSPRLGLYPRMGTGFANAVKSLDLSAAQSALFHELDPARPLSETLGEFLNSPAALATLWVLDELNALDFSEKPPEALIDSDPDFDADIELSLSKSDEGPKPTSTRNTPCDRNRVDRAEQLRVEIEQFSSAKSSLDHYQLLGLTPDAETGIIKKAYLQAAKKYHPDALARLGLQEIKSDASDVFSRISQAFEVLSNTDSRQAYDAEQRGDLSGTTAQLLTQAETTYRKGEILLRMGDFKGALPYLESAVELWPEEGVYQSALGWALYKQSAPEPEQAREYLARAIELTSEDPVAHFRLGMVLRALGDSERSQKHLDRAKELEPQAE